MRGLTPPARRVLWEAFAVMGPIVVTLITIVLVMGVMLGTCAYLIWVERKIAAYVQDRIGPNRVGPAGLFQPIADGLKFLFKEDIIPSHVDRLLFLAAPAIPVSTALLSLAVVPFGPTATPPNPPQRPAIAAEGDDLQKEEYARRLATYEKE